MTKPKDTHIQHCLTVELLRFVRDSKPTEEELLEWLGEPSQAGKYHTLRKAELLLLREGRIELSSDHLSADGKMFRFANGQYNLETGEVQIFYY